MGFVIDAVDEGHIGTDLKNNGEPTATSKCRNDSEKWPCATITAARSRDKSRRET